MKSYTKSPASIEDQIAEDEKEIERYMQMSLDSTQRSRQQLESSDKLAEGTARVKWGWAKEFRARFLEFILFFKQL